MIIVLRPSTKLVVSAELFGCCDSDMCICTFLLPTFCEKAVPATWVATGQYVISHRPCTLCCASACNCHPATYRKMRASASSTCVHDQQQSQAPMPSCSRSGFRRVPPCAPPCSSAVNWAHVVLSTAAEPRPAPAAARQRHLPCEAWRAPE